MTVFGCTMESIGTGAVGAGDNAPASCCDTGGVVPDAGAAAGAATGGWSVLAGCGVGWLTLEGVCTGAVLSSGFRLLSGSWTGAVLSSTAGWARLPLSGGWPPLGTLGTGSGSWFRFLKACSARWLVEPAGTRCCGV